MYIWLHYNVYISGRFGKDEYLLADILHGAISGLTAERDIKDVSIEHRSESNLSLSPSKWDGSSGQSFNFNPSELPEISLQWSRL
jgi:hypothetical protein